MAKPRKDLPCPCGGASYESCCAPLHRGGIADSAERLMRSRYSAYALGLMDYVGATWHPSTRPADLAPEAGIKWLGLEVRRQEQQGQAATVEFVARYKTGGRAQRLHEASRFVHEQGRWWYLDGSFPEQ